MFYRKIPFAHLFIKKKHFLGSYFAISILLSLGCAPERSTSQRQGSFPPGAQDLLEKSDVHPDSDSLVLYGLGVHMQSLP